MGSRLCHQLSLLFCQIKSDAYIPFICVITGVGFFASGPFVMEKTNAIERIYPEIDLLMQNRQVCLSKQKTKCTHTTVLQ